MLDMLKIIPRAFRLKGLLVATTILCRTLLNFMGIAALLPALYLLLDSENIHSIAWLSKLYDTFGFTSDLNFVIAICLCMVIFIVVKCLINMFLYRFERDYIYALYRYLSRNLYIDYFNRGLQFIKSSNSAVLSRNVNVICYTFVAGVLKPMAVIVSETLLFALIFISIIFYNPTIALLVMVIFAPIFLLYTTFIKQRVNQYGKIENEAQRHKFRDTVDTYRGYADIEINNAFGGMLSEFDANTDTMVSVGAKNATISTLPQIFTEIALIVGLTLLVALSVGLESADIKVLVGFFAVAALRLLPSIRAVMSSWTSLRYNRFAIDIIRDAGIDSPATIEDNTTERMSFQDKIAVSNLNFRFEDSQSNTLSEISFEIKKGEKIGINGASGSGKTTLFNLLLGLYAPTSGTITIDNQVLSAENRRKWQNAIGYVSQSVFLTDSTILANITLGCKEEDIDMNRVASAIEAASLSKFIDSLPNGVNTRIGECGALLSGGQRQRIGIARALYKGAEVLFFDEATSSLDSTTEQSINEAIESLAQADSSLTIVVIAHRDSSLSYCDRIITLE